MLYKEIHGAAFLRGGKYIIKKTAVSFAFLSLFVSLSLFASFHWFVLPKYTDKIWSEAQLSVNMAKDSLNNSILWNIDTISTELIYGRESQVKMQELASSDDFSLQQAYDIFNLIYEKKELSNLLYTVDIYFEESDLILSSTLGIQSAEKSMDTRFRWLSQDSLSEYVPGKQFIHSYQILGTSPTVFKSPLEIVSFSQLLKIPTSEGFKTAIINYGILKETFDSIFKVLLQEEGICLISDGTGNTIPIGRDTGLDSDSLAALKEYSNAEIANIGNLPVLICRADVGSSYQIIRLIPVDSIQSASYELLKTFVLALAVVLLISLLIGFLMSRRLYMPIKHLAASVRSIGCAAPDTATEKNDDITFISGTVHSLYGQVGTLKTALQENQAAARSHFLLELLTGTLSDETEIQRVDIDFPYHFFLVMEISFSQQVFGNIPIRDFLMSKVKVGTNLEGYQSSVIRLYPVETSEYAFRVLINTKDENYHGDLAKALYQAVAEMGNIGSAVTAAVGSAATSLQDLRRSRKNMEVAADYHYYYPYQELYFFDLLRIEQRALVLDDSGLKLLQKAQETVQIDTLIPISLELISHMRKGLYSINLLMQTLEKLSDLLNAAGKNYSHSKTGIEIKSAAAFNSLNDFENSIIGLSVHRREFLSRISTSRQKLFIDAAIQYIDKNLDKAISLDETANNIYISASYLSKLFKESTGKSFLEYVNNHKMMAAENLLISTSKSIEEIAKSTGFSSANYFIRRFKQYYGVTPKVYRLSHIESGNSKG